VYITFAAKKLFQIEKPKIKINRKIIYVTNIVYIYIGQCYSIPWDTRARLPTGLMPTHGPPHFTATAPRALPPQSGSQFFPAVT
jgi:hypothetical protein